MLELPNVTILAVDCITPEESIKAINYSCKNIRFKDRILLTSENMASDNIKVIKIDKLNGLNDYSNFMLRLIEYVDSDFVLVVQPDGYVLNHVKWIPEWLNLDYIGAVWPNEQSWVEIQKANKYLPVSPNPPIVGNGGFSLRSRKFLELSYEFVDCEGFGEDAYLCATKRGYMLANGIKFAHPSFASIFSRENNLSDWRNPGIHLPEWSFGFHGKNFVNSKELIDFKNG